MKVVKPLPYTSICAIRHIGLIAIVAIFSLFWGYEKEKKASNKLPRDPSFPSSDKE